MPGEQEQRTVVFEGDVQGVGFRYTACRLAGQHDVTGYVRNLPDGRVECLIEGGAGEIDAFLKAIQARMAAHIRQIRQQKAQPSSKYCSFTVRY
jgi:acylphosphatase